MLYGRDKMHSFLNAMTVDADRRKKLRKKPLSLVYVELASANGGMMRDLSEEGFAMRAMMPLKAGQRVPFVFSLDEFTRIEGEGLVDWIDQKGRVVGVKFVLLPPEARDKIDEWLLRADEPPAQEQDAAHQPAPTMEELREEMRSAPPRPLPGAEEPPSTEAEPGAPAAAPETPAPEEPPPAQASESPVPESPTPESPAPVLEDDIPFPLEPAEPLSVSEEHAEEAAEPALPEPALETASEPQANAQNSPLVALERKWRMPANAEFPPLPAADVTAFEPLERDPNLPDISSILMQPPGVSARSRTAVAHRETLPPSDERLAATRSSWTDGFTLSTAISIMFGLVLLVGAYVLHSNIGQGFIWLGEKMGGTPRGVTQAPGPDQAPTSSPATAGSTGLSSNLLPSDRGVARPANQPLSNTGTTQPPVPAPQDTPPNLRTEVSSSSAAAENDQEPGQPEYLQAQELLRANSGHGTPQVVQLLWISVEKGNPSAEIALADLYWHARGVARNCDQTRILLTAAARKGSTEAQRRLQRLQQDGCE